MKSRLLAAFVVVCLSVISGGSLVAQDVKSDVTAIEKSLWEAWKNKQTDPFRQNLADNTVGVSPMGITAGKEQVIKEMTASPCEVRSFSLSDWQVHEITPETVIVTYKAKQDATCQGNKVPADVVASSVYVKKDGKWLAASHFETPVMQSPTMKAE
ncbi:MAG: nuclear transport factor 2 family protein [Acidobacteria bacterium]|nr:MAG: nuclear transport factor 2 family protein [Acidobacteriota bacterium]